MSIVLYCSLTVMNKIEASLCKIIVDLILSKWFYVLWTEEIAAPTVLCFSAHHVSTHTLSSWCLHMHTQCWIQWHVIIYNSVAVLLYPWIITNTFSIWLNWTTFFITYRDTLWVKHQSINRNLCNFLYRAEFMSSLLNYLIWNHSSKCADACTDNCYLTGIGSSLSKCVHV